MGRWWALGRLGHALLAAWGITSVIFLLLQGLAPIPDSLALGDPSDVSSGLRLGTQANRQAALQALRHRLGLDEPLFYITRTAGSPPSWHWHGVHNQYHQWFSHLLRGDLGVSYRTGQPVAQLLGPALAYTIPLMVLALAVASTLAVWLALGLANAPARGGSWRASVRALLAGMQVLPLFTVALALLLLLANPDVLNVLPADGMRNYPPLGTFAWLLSYGAHAVLPLLSLVLTALPELTLTLEAALRQELVAGYATTARAKGLTSWQLLRRHALPNALLPLVTTFTSLLPGLVSGAVVVEVLFAMPGTGRLLATAAASHDYPVVLAGVLLTATARLLALLVADILYFWADPRLRPAS